jgi:DNA modification methylase
MNFVNQIIPGDCKEVLKELPDNVFNLVITSPPYADAREKTYGGVHPDKYVEWFLLRSAELLRTLRNDGTFILNIKEKVVDGERHTYVLDLIKALRTQGWLWTEEFVWCKKNSTPGKWPNRFRDSWERLLQFNKQKTFAMYQDAVMVPMGKWAKSRLKKLGENDTIRHTSQVGSGFGKNVANWVERKMAYPSNVLHLATECSNKQHSAVFPSSLPKWFIKLFNREGDIVLDPFVGSGTACLAAKEMNRFFTGIELDKEYYKITAQKFL